MIWTPDGRLAVIRRGTTPVGGLAFVSGFMEVGETWRACAVRELLEEAGIAIGAERVDLVTVAKTVHGQLVIGEVRVDWYELDAFRATTEATELLVLYPAQLKQSHPLCFPAHQAALELRSTARRARRS